MFAQDGQVITGKDFHGFVTVRGKNITFRNCTFRGGTATHNSSLLDTEGGVGTVVEDSEFVAAHPSAFIEAGISARSTRVLRANIHGGVDGMKTSTDVLVQDSWIHDMNWFASDPNQGGGATHNDGVQSSDSDITLRHNTIDLSTTQDANAAWQVSATNARADGNWLDGGGCTLNFNHLTPAGLTGIFVTNNRFGRHSDFNCPILISTKTILTQNSGNVFDDTGQPIPSPQQHN